MLMAAAAAFAITNRSRLETRIEHISLGERGCLAQRARTAGDCGLGHLVQLREGDLLGLPFIALGLGLFLLLVYKIGRPGSEPRLSAIGDSGSDEPIV
jgi:hypothetical protein